MCDYKFDIELCKRQIEQIITPIENNISLHIRSNPNSPNLKEEYKEFTSSNSKYDFKSIFNATIKEEKKKGQTS